AVRGEIDIFTAPEFKQRIGAAIDDGRELVVVDLGETTFIDSSSLGVLISAHRRLASRKGRLVIACDVPAVRNTFKVTGLDTVLGARLPLARGIARRYWRGDEPLEDLEQVATLGLLKALRSYDPSRGTSFASYAIPTMNGELRRHYRDTGWAVHVPRGTQELA